MSGTSVVELSAWAVTGAGAGRVARFLVERWLRTVLPSARLPPRMCELSVAVGWPALAFVDTSSLTHLVGGALLLWWCTTVSAVDVTVRRLPNVFTMPGYAGVLLWAAVVDQLGAALVGSAMLAGVHLTMYLVSPGSIGAGDVKLALALGGSTAMLGSQVWLGAAALAPVLTATAGAVTVLARRRGPCGERTSLPHGPSMCAATMTSYIALT
ncbi:leader peptidase (prepilin peptidase)/N-methyltransferase [Rhodococcus sp. 27YEA15]|uniref:prepilin peptidase n=1 Tax=Rhodococcus sp. 27YEA15 TaxID=3156259 RepID=UPI003C7CE08B